MHTDNSDLFVVWVGSMLMIYGAISLINLLFGKVVSYILLGICMPGGYYVCNITLIIFIILIATIAIGITRIYYKQTRCHMHFKEPPGFSKQYAHQQYA